MPRSESVFKKAHTERDAPKRDVVDDLTGTSVYYTSKLTPSWGTTSVQHPPHVRNFLDCVKTRQKPNANIEVGHWTTTACHLGNISFRVGQKVLWDAREEKITNHEKANELVTRQYRAPWKLES